MAELESLVGREATFRRTLSETDLILFSGLTGDLHPVHLDAGSAETRDAGGRTIHAVFLLGLASTAASRLVLGAELRTRVHAFRSVEVCGSAHPGDTVAAKACVDSLLTSATLPKAAQSAEAPRLLEVAITVLADSGTMLLKGVIELELV